MPRPGTDRCASWPPTRNTNAFYVNLVHSHATLPSQPDTTTTTQQISSGPVPSFPFDIDPNSSWAIEAACRVLRHSALPAIQHTIRQLTVAGLHMCPENLSFKRFPQFDKPLAVWDMRYSARCVAAHIGQLAMYPHATHKHAVYIIIPEHGESPDSLVYPPSQVSQIHR